MKISLALIDRIKHLLKEKRITYSQLASGLELSESTLKRWFSQKNFSLQQLELICNYADISLEELLKTNVLEDKQPYFSQAQEKVFDENEKSLAVYYLTAFGLSFNEILSSYQYTKAELIKILTQLEKVNLLDLYPQNKIIVKKDLSTMWIPKGKLSKKYFKQIRSEFMNTYFSDQDEKQFFLSGRLTAESSRIIQKKIDKLSEEIRELYLLDSKEEDANNISIFMGMRPWSFSLVTKYQK